MLGTDCFIVNFKMRVCLVCLISWFIGGTFEVGVSFYHLTLTLTLTLIGTFEVGVGFCQYILCGYIDHSSTPVSPGLNGNAVVTGGERIPSDVDVPCGVWVRT